MNKENFYRLVIIALLLLNAGTLGYLLFNNQRDNTGFREHRPPRPDEVINERLGLDDRQREQFDGFRHEHHTAMLDITERSSVLHEQLFALLKEPAVDTAKKDSLLTAIQQLNREKELVTFDHFQKLRSILMPQQQQEFDRFVEELSRRIMGPHKHGRP